MIRTTALRMLLALALTAFAGCGLVAVEVTNAPGVPECAPGRAQCR